ncbi:EthD family reductase [Pleomorphovibrio marinus]|uniref:EthD family reductase n=1 Tax=Pleomorphovibrio marinus TaxID=2164132 RepID=UPI000E0A4E11|nr:EthD family reductase [Pleomorphovibrio marinus]
MIRVTVAYPNSDNAEFDMDYYVNKHVPLVRERLSPMGLKEIVIEQGLSGMEPNSAPPFVVIGSLTFEDQESMQSALATHAEELIADIANFSNIQPQMLISNLFNTVEA